MMWVLWLIVVILASIWLFLLSLGFVYVFRKQRNKGPQGVDGPQGENGMQGQSGMNGVQGVDGQRGFQGASGINIPISAKVQIATFHARAGIAFDQEASTANYSGNVSLTDKLLTLQFSNLHVHTTAPNLKGFTLSLDLPTGYSMVSSTTPFVSWLGSAYNLNQLNSTVSPIFLFDMFRDSDTTFTMTWLPIFGTINLETTVSMFCNFNIVLNIV